MCRWVVLELISQYFGIVLPPCFWVSCGRFLYLLPPAMCPSSQASAWGWPCLQKGVCIGRALCSRPRRRHSGVCLRELRWSCGVLGQTAQKQNLGWRFTCTRFIGHALPEGLSQETGEPGERGKQASTGRASAWSCGELWSVSHTSELLPAGGKKTGLLSSSSCLSLAESQLGGA